MPRSNSLSPKQPPKHAGKHSRARDLTSESTPPSEAVVQLSKSLPKNLNRSKAASLRGLNKNRKRKPSISSISSVSSISAIQEDSEDEADSEASSDDDEDRPADVTPSYGSKTSRGSKTGSLTNGNKKRKLSYDDGYDGDVQPSNAENENDSDSSDAAYAAVDDITDADEEELDVEKLEEQLIVESENERLKTDSILSLSDADADDWSGLGALDDHVPFSTASFLDEDQLYSAMDTFGETDMTSEAIETPVQRHVHFEEADSDSSSDSSTDDELPGDFLQQDSLDPTLRRMIENDQDTLGQNQRYDDIFGELDYNHPANIYHVESDAISDGSSGYESMYLQVGLSSRRFFTDCLQPMMVKPRTKICHPQRPSPTPGRFFAVTPRALCPRRGMRMASGRLLLAAADQEWVPLLPIPANQWLWSTAPASTSSSSLHMRRLAMTGSSRQPTASAGLQAIALVPP